MDEWMSGWMDVVDVRMNRRWKDERGETFSSFTWDAEDVDGLVDAVRVEGSIEGEAFLEVEISG